MAYDGSSGRGSGAGFWQYDDVDQKEKDAIRNLWIVGFWG
jgi:hypothetical protein